MSGYHRSGQRRGRRPSRRRKRPYYHEASLIATWTGSRLAIGALSFLFGAFLFAYFYLESSNGHSLWLPSSTKPPSNAYGLTIFRWSQSAPS